MTEKISAVKPKQKTWTDYCPALSVAPGAVPSLASGSATSSTSNSASGSAPVKKPKWSVFCPPPGVASGSAPVKKPTSVFITAAAIRS